MITLTILEFEELRDSYFQDMIDCGVSCDEDRDAFEDVMASNDNIKII
jgi:hypothetical protein